MASIRIKSGTRAQLNAAAAASLLAAREPYFIVDEGRFAVGTSASAYTAFAKEADVATTRVWASGMTVAQGERVISPLDWEEYRRTAATGGGSTDPADDLTNYIAASYERATGILASNTTKGLGGAFSSIFSAFTVASLPAVGAGVRTLAFSLSGRGTLSGLAVTRGGSTDTMRVELIVDGRTIYNVVQSYGPTQVWLGPGISFDTGSGVIGLTSDAIQFRRSIAVYVTPTVATVANAIQAAYRGRSLS